jgi:hypothetical protein
MPSKLKGMETNASWKFCMAKLAGGIVLGCFDGLRIAL